MTTINPSYRSLPSTWLVRSPQKAEVPSPFSHVNINLANRLYDIFLNVATLAISQAHSWIDSTPSFLHPIKSTIIKLVLTQFLMCLSIPFRIDPSPRNNNLELNVTWFSAIRHKLPCIPVKNSLSQDCGT